MQVEMQLVRIVISETDDQQVIILKEADGERHFPTWSAIEHQSQ